MIGVASAWSARAERFDAVLLDLGLVDGDGSELLRRLRLSPPRHRRRISNLCRTRHALSSSSPRATRCTSASRGWTRGRRLSDKAV